jgi:hypothetical protein
MSMELKLGRRGQASPCTLFINLLGNASTVANYHVYKLYCITKPYLRTAPPTEPLARTLTESADITISKNVRLLGCM